MSSNRLYKCLQNLNLYKKILLIIAMACLALLGGNYIVLKRVYRSYDEQLYIRTAQMFTTYVEQVEVELKNLNMITLSMIGNDYIQKNLTIIRDYENGSNEWRDARRNLTSQLRSYLYNVNSCSNFEIYAVNGGAVSPISYLSGEDHEKLAEMAAQAQGAPVVVQYSGNLYYLRQIREAENFAFDNLATIIAELDLHKILAAHGNVFAESGAGADMLVFVDGACVYGEEEENEEISLLEKDGWQLQGDNFIVQYTTSRGWKFLICTPYGQINSAVRVMRIRSAIWTVLIALAALAVSYLLVVKVTRELERLLDKFDAYAKGILPDAADMERYRDRKDEIGRLHRHFAEMAYEYKRVSEENYRWMILQKEAQYNQLQQQIQPHFIFNTLSMITWIAYEHKDAEISELANALAGMFREALMSRGKVVTVEDELKLVQDYMLIQQRRYRKRLDFSVDMPQELEKVLIPQMTLQPIVENAVKYALEEMMDSCTIRVYGRKEGTTAVLIVEDNGPGIDEDVLQKLERGEIKAGGNGIGLQNIQKRIRLLFSGEYGLEFHRIDGWTQVWIRVPLGGGG